MATYYYETTTFETNQLRNYNQTVSKGGFGIGSQSSWHSRKYRGSCRPDLSGIPSNATITSASFVITCYSNDGAADSTPYIWRATYNWETDYTCWDTYNSIGSAWLGGEYGKDYELGNAYAKPCTAGTVITIPVNAYYVTQWVDATVTNNGFIIKQGAGWTSDGQYWSTFFTPTYFKAYYTLVDTVGAGRASWFI